MSTLQIETDSKGVRVVTRQTYRVGEVIYPIGIYRTTDTPTYRTVQIGPSVHILEFYLARMNHSCRPNVCVDTTKMVVVAARDIRPGEELTFFYPSTEWAMDRPFICNCGAAECLGLVAGAKFLSNDTLARYLINQHIVSRIRPD